MTRWSLSPSTRLTGGPLPGGGVFTIAWDSTHDGGRQRHMMHIDLGTSPENLDGRDLFVRALCHVLVHRMPRRGLEELAECLGGMFRYYENEAGHRAQLPPAALTRARTVRTETPYVPRFEEE